MQLSALRILGLKVFCLQSRQHLLLHAEIGTKQQWLLANYACPTGLFTIQQMEDIKQHFA